MCRYRKQILLHEIGEEGQKLLGVSRAVVIGCGALGTVIANTLVRMGIGSICIVGMKRRQLLIVILPGQ